MNCVYGPYQISSDLESIGEFTFVDNSAFKRSVVFVGCSASPNPPCPDAVALHTEDNCSEGSKVYWYECPSILGRQYTILPTPCGITISSFEDGLIATKAGDASNYGSETFCFGKIYTSIGSFDSPDKSSVTFEFDGHAFSVKGISDECNELFDCSECQPDATVSVFEALPTAPDDSSSPESENSTSNLDVPETEVIPAEGRSQWLWDATTSSFGDTTLCEGEKPLTSWLGEQLDTCSSNDNPSIATLPSGHTIVAYENRGEDGKTKITVAVLSSSVRENIRYHRRLGTGTLLNNLLEAEGLATFIVYEEMFIPADDGVPANGEKIGFLTGPLAGGLFTVTKITRVREGDVIRHEFNFLSGTDVEFPDKNNVYDVKWFLTDNAGSADLPSSENITAVLDLPYHLDAESNVLPVANPSIAVARNNQMVAHEQNIYVTYQAFEDNQWRVYLREIVLGTTEDLAPVYISPYLFDENVRQIETMALSASSVSASSISEITFVDDDFSSSGLLPPITNSGKWTAMNDIQIPPWFWFDGSDDVSYVTEPLRYWNGEVSQGATGLPATPCSKSGGSNCAVAFNLSSTENNIGLDDSTKLRDHTRSFSVSIAPTTHPETGNNISDLSFKMRFHIVLNDTPTTGNGLTEYPEVWFLMGRDLVGGDLQFNEGYRLQIRRGKGCFTDSQVHDGPINLCRDSCSFSGCFIFSLYTPWSPKIVGGQDSWFDRNPAFGDQTDLPTRSIWKCIDDEDFGAPGDYSFDDWNEWRVETYVRGFYRFFEIYLKHPSGAEGLMATFREWEEDYYPSSNGTGTFSFGKYHGFGFAQSYSGNAFNRAKHQVLVDRFTIKSRAISSSDKIYFFEDFCERAGTMLSAPTNIDNCTPLMSNEAITTNSDYDGTAMNFCRTVILGDVQGDSFYPLDNSVRPTNFGTFIRLGPQCGSFSDFPPNGWASFLRILPRSTDDKPSGNQASHQDAVSMVVGINRIWKVHNGAYPHIWMVGRLANNTTQRWWQRYRLRISRFDCISDYPSVHTGLSENDKIWRLTAYTSGTGSNSDSKAAENYYIIGTDTDIDWTDYSSTGGGTGTHRRSVWTYFKIDMYNSTVDGAAKVNFDVYVGNDAITAANVHPDDVEFEILGSLQVDAISTGVDGPYFGLALFSGAKDESAEGLTGDDYRSSAYLNYLSLSTIGDAGSPVTGACCRAIGGCTENTQPQNCQSPDIWYGDATCLQADCSSDFPTGAGCTSDGICHDGITEAEAAAQGIPDEECTGCGWQAGAQCNPSSPNYRNCPAAVTTGSCCRPSNSTCVDDLAFAECQTYFGITDPSIFGAFDLGNLCGSPGSSSPDCVDYGASGLGACCFAGSCSITTETICNNSSGTFLGVETDCVTPGCSLEGACCDGVGGCTQEIIADCIAAGNTFLGAGVSCTPDPCGEVDSLAACCYFDGTCVDTIESACGPLIGEWKYGYSCSDLPCDAVSGACCDPFTGECEDGVTKDDCQNSGRVFAGATSQCAYVDCDQPLGACCIGLNCVGGKTFQECGALGGNFQGFFTNCIEGLCLGDADGDPYADTSVVYKPEDLWVIEIDPGEYVTRVLYHMQEQINLSSIERTTSGNKNNTIDFMFLIDHSGSMQEEIDSIALAVPDLAEGMVIKGLDVRFGYTFFGRRGSEDPVPASAVTCTCEDIGTRNPKMANGLQATSRCQAGNNSNLVGINDGFTRNVEYLQRALNCWGVGAGLTAPWAAMQFVSESSEFAWRENAAKYVFLVTDTDANETCTSCGTYTMSESEAQASLIDNGIVLIPVVAINDASKDNAPFLRVAAATGWSGDPLDVASGDYGDLFNTVINTIDSTLRIDNATIMERAVSGTENTFLKKGEVIITYSGDLSDLWTFNKTDFVFKDDHAPFPGTADKQLSNFPFGLHGGTVYGIDPVHIQGNPSNWVSFGQEGALIYSHPDVGHRASGVNESPVLIAANSARPKVYVNNRNQVIVAYEDYSTGTPQIGIRGTGDFYQNSIVGPKARRIQRLLNQGDFAYYHAITLPGEGMNQLCDFVIDNSDITHIVWQSSRDSFWEIYYANSYNLFEPVRITQSDSRSSHPTIDVDEAGSIFVVYHDDRFGPFNILLSSKDEERVIPLIEQDAYLASLRNDYTHYTNIVPLFLDNPSGEAPDLGIFWGNKNDDDAGNDSETYVYQVDESSGTPSNGFNLKDVSSVFKPASMAFSSKNLYGINGSGNLFKMGSIAEDEVNFAPTSIGNIELNIDGFQDASILDIDVDQFDRIWVLIHEVKTGVGIGTVTTFAANNRFRLEYVSGSNAQTVARGIIKEDEVDSADGGSLTITSDNKFHITWEDSPNFVLSSSEYPTISEGVATFNFADVGNLTPSITPVAMTSDANDTLFSVTSDNDLYTVSKLNATTTLQTSLTTGSGSNKILPVGTTASIAYQLLDKATTGGAEFFHIRIDFYDNIAYEGSPYLSVDSRENLEAFINEETLSDPYLDPYATVFGMDARGVHLELDQIGIVFFDVTHFVPGFSRLAQPYSFEPNQTYFLRAFLIDDAGAVRESGIVQRNSFSCTKCSRFGNNNFNSNICAYSFVIENSESETYYYNFQIDFYADTGKQHLIRRFEAVPGSDDLQYLEVDNVSAIGLWTDAGLPIPAGDAAFIQVHPVLDPSAGFLCGVTYAVQVNECHDTFEKCSNFTVISPSNWKNELVGGGGNLVKDDLDLTAEVMLGLSMKNINDKLCIVWRTKNDQLEFAQLEDEGWTHETIPTTGDVYYCDLANINGKPTVSIVELQAAATITSVLSRENEAWNAWPNMTKFVNGRLENPRSLIEYNDAPFIAAAGADETGLPFFLSDEGSTSTWGTEASCFSPFSGEEGGSCVVTAVVINGLPAVAYIADGAVKYAAWDEDSGAFVNIQTVSSGDSVVRGKVGLAEIAGQPAIAYIKSAGGGFGQLVYRRYNGTSWIDSDTNSKLYTFNKHLAMSAINGQPHIVYSIRTSSTTSQLRHTFFNESRFIDGAVEDVSGINHTVDIAEYLNEPAVIVSSNPFRVYLFRQTPSMFASELRPVYFCECASNIFTNRLTHLSEVSRWESSAHGFADTAVTDSPKDSLRPNIKTRTTGAAIIIWEDMNQTNNCPNPPCIRAATFRNANQDQLRGSGTNSWFDYDFGIAGQDVDLSLDIYDRINSIYEKPKPVSPEGLHGRQLDKSELPTNELYGKVCDFLISEVEISDTDDPGACDLSALMSNVISFDEFISKKLVRKIKVKDEFVEYYTYNASSKLTAIVSTCNIALEIHGTPEIVAIRFRNENKSVWSSWCPWSPLTGDFVMEKEHKISGGTGIKEVCIQAMTYNGITTEFCLPIIADYETVVFATRFYKNKDAEGNEITSFTTLDNAGFFPSDLDEQLVKLPLSEGIAVANLAPEGGNLLIEVTVLVEIIPNEEFAEEKINFDVVQQGSNDKRGLVAVRGKNNEGRVVYRGEFSIEKEDKVFNVDGLARVNPAFPSACSSSDDTVTGASDVFIRDSFNEISDDLEVEVTKADALEAYRQETSGRVGVTLDVRSLEDPYFIFGDPNYSLKKTDGQRRGVPFSTAETEIAIGSAPDQDGGFCPEPPGGCPEGFEWQGWPDCQCREPSG